MSLWKRNRENFQIDRRKHRKKRKQPSRNESDVATNPETSPMMWSQERKWAEYFLVLLEGAAFGTLISDFEPPDYCRINCYCFKPLSLWFSLLLLVEPSVQKREEIKMERPRLCISWDTLGTWGLSRDTSASFLLIWLNRSFLPPEKTWVSSNTGSRVINISWHFLKRQPGSYYSFEWWLPSLFHLKTNF